MITLERFTEADFQTLINWIDSEELLMNWSGALFSFPLTNRSMSWYSRDSNIPGKSDAFIYKVADADSGVAIGHISLGGISWKNKSARITRVFVDPAYGCKGVCQQMTKAILKIGFDDLQLHRIGLGVYSHNAAAIRCYEKAGLIQEGTQRDVLFHNNKFLSMVEMAVLEDDWRKIQD